MRMNPKRFPIAALLFVLACGVSGPALAQQDNSQSGGSQMPPDQGATTNTAPATQLQPSEIQEQQIEQQQAQPPGG
jgi:hypothetical protein